METKINIYGRDYSKIDFTQYTLDKGTGIEFVKGGKLFQGENREYNAELARLISIIFLQRLETQDYSRFIESDKRSQTRNWQNQDKQYCLYKMEVRDGKKEYSFGNIVGVIYDKDFNITREEIEQYKKEYRGSKNYTEDGLDGEDHYSWLDDQLEKRIVDSKYKIKLQIGSRFDSERAFFLPTLMLGSMPDTFDHSVPSNEDNIYNFLLVYWYKKQLLDAYIEGPYRRYSKFYMNDSRLKGAIDIARHIKLNMGLDNGNIAYSYRENTADNPVNHLFLYTFEYIKKYYPLLAESVLISDDNVRSIIGELYSLCKSFQDSNISSTINKSRRTIGHPFYYKYDKLRKTSLMILEHLGVSMFDGNDEEVQGILFYIPDLWELFLENMLKDKMKLEGQGQRKVFGSIESEGRSNFKKNTYPDYIFMDENNKQIMILDAKYRKVWSRHFVRKNCDLDDYTKCIRDMNTINVHGTGVIFPIKEDYLENIADIAYKEEYIRHKISQYNKYDNFYTFPILVPGTDREKSYGEWSKLFHENIARTTTLIKEAFDKEKERGEEVYGAFEQLRQKICREEDLEVLERIMNMLI